MFLYVDEDEKHYFEKGTSIYPIIFGNILKLLLILYIKVVFNYLIWCKLTYCGVKDT